MRKPEQKYQAILQKNDFTGLVLPDDMQLVPQHFAWKLQGGPDEALVQAKASRRSLWWLFNHLRAPIRIVDRAATRLWWGIVHAITLQLQGMTFTVSIQDVKTRVAVAYTYVPEGGTGATARDTTGWAENTVTAGYYGAKELLLTEANTTLAETENLRDTRLAALSIPRAQMMFGGVGKGVNPQATLLCRGLVDTLDWQYYPQDAGVEAYIGDDPIAAYAFGQATTSETWAQSFQLTVAKSVLLESISLRLCKLGVGAPPPVDNLLVRVCADAAGDPGVALKTATVLNADIPESTYPGEWVEADFTSGGRITLSPATTYWITVGRAGGISATDYFKICGDEDLGYANGEHKIYDSTIPGWTKWVVDHDVVFRILGVWETTTQIEAAITDKAQFFTGSAVVSTGVYSCPCRGGDTTTWKVIGDLLKRGDSSQSRLRATVTSGRELKVETIPSKPADRRDAALLCLPSGELLDRARAPIPADAPPVNKWAVLSGVVDPVFDPRRVGLLDIFLVGRATFDCNLETWKAESEAATEGWSAARIQEG